MRLWLVGNRHVMRTFDAAQVAQLRVAALGGGDVCPVQRAQASKPCYDLRAMHDKDVTSCRALKHAAVAGTLETLADRFSHVDRFSLAATWVKLVGYQHLDVYLKQI